MSVSQLAELSNSSKSYISQVKHGKRSPSKKLTKVLWEYTCQNDRRKGYESLENAINSFLKSRREGVSPGTIEFYSKYLTNALPVLGLNPKAKDINKYFFSLTCSTGGKHAYYRAISIFYHWLYSPKSGFDYADKVNPIMLVEAPKRPKLILPSLSKSEVELLLRQAHCTRDKAIIALFTESGLRLSELLRIKLSDIDWNSGIIRVIGKGNKEGYAPFGDLSRQYLEQWLSEFHPGDYKPIWNIGFWGIKALLDDLKAKTGLPCNPHTFRRTFACLLTQSWSRYHDHQRPRALGVTGNGTEIYQVCHISG